MRNSPNSKHSLPGKSEKISLTEEELIEISPPCSICKKTVKLSEHDLYYLKEDYFAEPGHFFCHQECFDKVNAKKKPKKSLNNEDYAEPRNGDIIEQ